MAKKNYHIELPTGEKLTFDSRDAMQKYEDMVKLFTPDPVTNKVPHTNMEPEVRLSEDNPMSEGKLVPIGIQVDLKTVSDSDWDKKYKGQDFGYAKEVASADIYDTIHPKAKENQPIPSGGPVQSVIGASPYSPNQAQPQNLRYEKAAEAAYKQAAEADPNMVMSPTNTPCDVCEGVAVQWGAEVYKCADGDGPYYFSNLTINGGQQAGPFMVGKSYKCNPNYGSQPGGDCHQTSCWGPIWHVTQVIPTGQVGPGTINTQMQAHMCVDLIEDCNCPTYPYTGCGDCSEPGIPIQAPFPTLPLNTYASGGCEFIGVSNVQSEGFFVTPNMTLGSQTPFMLNFSDGSSDMQSWLTAYIIGQPPHNQSGTVNNPSGTSAKWGDRVFFDTRFFMGNPYFNMKVTANIDLPNSQVIFEDSWVHSNASGNAYLWNDTGGQSVNITNAVNTTNPIAMAAVGPYAIVEETFYTNDQCSICRIDFDPVTKTYNDTFLFNLPANEQPGGDMVYRPFDNTIVILSRNWVTNVGIISHYNMSGLLIATVASNPAAYSYTAFCYNGNVYSLTTTNKLYLIDVDSVPGTITTTLIQDPTLWPFPPTGAVTGGDGATNSECCNPYVAPTCATPGQI